VIQWPNKVGGRAPLAGWLNRLIDRCRASEIKTVIGGRIIESSDGKTIVIDSVVGGSGAAPTGLAMIYVGEWLSTRAYAAQEVVTRGALGEFICVQAVAGGDIGTAPETGAPFWHGWAYPPPGVWA